MARLFRSKINNLMVTIPPGIVLTSNWLEKHGVSSKLAWWYVHSGWLEHLGDRAYKKSGDHVSWIGAVFSLQTQLHLPIYIGAKTALQLLGQAHFIPIQGIKQITLFSHPGSRVPRWLNNNKLWKVDFKIHKVSLFQNDERRVGIIERPVDTINILLSSPERAAMEILYLVPNQQSFDEAVLLIQNLGRLRSEVVQSLLEQCNSIKVKRLFLHIAERFQHEWLSELDLKKINLGRGKRVIGKGGKYDSKYQLSVPNITEE